MDNNKIMLTFIINFLLMETNMEQIKTFVWPRFESSSSVPQLMESKQFIC